MMMRRLTNIFVWACLLWAAGISRAEDMAPRTPPLAAPLPPVSASLARGDTEPASLDMSTEESQEGQVSLKKAMILSFILPGAGQYYADSRFKGQVFMGVEAAIWSAFIGYRVYGGWKKDDYQAYAAAHAGVDNSGKNEEFYDWVGFYNNREEFNQFGRLYYPDRAYLPDNSSYDWQWQSEKDRLTFKELKDASETAFRNSTFLIGLAIANRVIAGIDTYRTVKAAQAKVRSLTQIGPYMFAVKTKVFGDNPGIKVTVTRKF